jgi:hypothetical protein
MEKIILTHEQVEELKAAGRRKYLNEEYRRMGLQTPWPKRKRSPVSPSMTLKSDG